MPTIATMDINKPSMIKPHSPTVGTSPQPIALETAIGLESSAQKASITAAASSPGAMAKSGSSIFANQIKHVPGPAPSKSNGGAVGSANTIPSLSVITQAGVPVPASSTVTSIRSGTPSSAQIVVSDVVEIAGAVAVHKENGHITSTVKNLY